MGEPNDDQAGAANGGCTDDVAEPERLLCPITHIMYRDPCFVPESGNTYERAAVERYWSSTPQPRDPLTNVELSSKVLHTNWGVRREVQRFLDDHPGYRPQGWADRLIPAPQLQPGDSSLHSGATWRLHPSCRCLAFLGLVLPVLLALVLRSRPSELWRSSHPSPPDDSRVLHPPKHSLLKAWKSTESDELTVYAPRHGFDGDTVGQLAFAVFWTGFTGLWTAGALQNGAPVIFAMFSLPFWGVGVSLLANSIKAPFQGELLEMDAKQYTVSKDWFGFVFLETVGDIADLSGPPIRQCDEAEHCQLIFQDGLKELTFGAWLKAPEASWVQKEVMKHLQRVSDEDERFDALPKDRTGEPGQTRFNQRSMNGGFQFGVVIR